MNETEKRRAQLLKNTRKLYDSHYNSWPVHQGICHPLPLKKRSRIKVLL